MSFLDIDVKKKYRSSDTENIAKSFIEKVLNQSVKYKRAVGFFSSSSLIYTSRGLAKIAENYKGGEPVIQYIVSPRLTKEDVEAIKKGYKTREKVVEEAIDRDFVDVQDSFEKERLNMISNLISSGAMDIKIAITNENDDIGMYHEKIGIFYDNDLRKIAFTGSLNESINAYLRNFESIRVYRSWENENDDVVDIEYDFDCLWKNVTKKVKIMPFPNAVKERLFKYKKETYDREIDRHEDESVFDRKYKDDAYPKIPDTVSLFDYQKKAIKNWYAKKSRGIFDMATGTGKTFTAYGAIVTLMKQAKYKMAVIILCPYQHLVEQWVEDAPTFNINDYIVGYSSHKYSDYLIKLKNAVQDYIDGIRDNFFFFCTNATFKLDKVQEVLSKLNDRVLIVADEAHNLGTKKFSEVLDEKYKYRLGLSATFERYRDEEGTNQIYKYFGEKCIEYDLQTAINEDKLTKYYYYPIVTTLSPDEIDEYKKLSEVLKKNVYPGPGGSVQLTKQGEKIAIQRARLVAGAVDKIEKLRKEMVNHLDENNILVYCGTSKLESDNGEEIKQIDVVSRMLGFDLNMNVGRYTSQESADERKIIKERFAKGDLQALVAIKCLDEGVNIPGIKTAFILASSTNPREYVQRRGRVLRKAPGKDYAAIYDFITLPYELSEMSQHSYSVVDDFKSLAKNEINRMSEFSRLSLNPSETTKLIDEINDKYQLNKFIIDETFETIEWNEDDYE